MKYLLFLIATFLLFPAIAQITPHKVKVIMDDYEGYQSINLFIDLFAIENTDFSIKLEVIKTDDLNLNSIFEPSEKSNIMRLDTTMAKGEHVLRLEVINNSYTGIKYSVIMTVENNQYSDQLHLENIQKDQFWSKLFDNAMLSNLMKIVTIPLLDANTTNVLGIYSLDQDTVQQLIILNDIAIKNAQLFSNGSVIFETNDNATSSISMYDYSTETCTRLFAGKSPHLIPEIENQFIFIQEDMLTIGLLNNVDSVLSLDVRSERIIRVQRQEEQLFVIHQLKDDSGGETIEYHLIMIDPSSWTVQRSEKLVPFSFINNLQLISNDGSRLLKIQSGSISVGTVNDINEEIFTKFNLPHEYSYTGATWSADGNYILFYGESN